MDDAEAEALYTAGQSLVTALNSPSASSSTSSRLLRQLYDTATTQANYLTTAKPVASQPQSLPDPPVAKADFETFLARNGDALAGLARRVAARDASQGSPAPAPPGQGEGLMASMRQVPRLFFREDFFLGDADTFCAVAAAAAAGGFSIAAPCGGGRSRPNSSTPLRS